MPVGLRQLGLGFLDELRGHGLGLNEHGGKALAAGEFCNFSDGGRRVAAFLREHGWGRSAITVLENLAMGAYARPRRAGGQDLERVLAMFPRLRERRAQV